MKKAILVLTLILFMAVPVLADMNEWPSSGEISSSSTVTVNSATAKRLKACMIETSGGDATVQFYDGSGGTELTPAITIASGESGYFEFSSFYVAAPNGLYVTLTNAVVVVYCKN